MIEKLRLASYGRFGNAEFHLGKSTIFVGPNEAGKTTIYDAIFEALCAPGGNKKAGKSLKARYTSARTVDLKPVEAKSAVDEEDFRNIHAIRAGEVTFGDAWDEKWISGLKGRLLTSGVDLSAVIARLEEQGSDKGSLKHNRDLKELRKDLEERIQNRCDLAARREGILAEEKRIKEAGAQLPVLKGRVDELEKKRAELERVRAQEEKILARARAKIAFDDAARRLDILEKLDTLSKYAVDQTADLERATQDRQNAAAEARLAGERTADCRERHHVAESEARRQQDALADGARRGRFANESIGKLQAVVDQTKSVARRNWTLIGLGVVLGVGGVVAGVWLGDAVGVVISVAAMVAASLCIWRAHRTQQVPDVEARTRACQTQRRLWNEAEPEHPAEGESLEDLLAFFRRIVADSDHLRAALEIARKQRDEAANKLAETERLEARAREQQDTTQRAEHELFARLAVGSVAEYASKRGKYTQLQVELAGGARQRAELEQQKHEASRKLKDFDEEGVPTSGRDDAQRVALSEEISEVTKALEQDRKALAELDKRCHGDEQKTIAELKGIPEHLDRLDRDIRRLEAGIAAIERDKSASIVAARLFAEINTETDVQMEELQALMLEYVRVGLGQETALLAPGLRPGELEVTDAGGEVRAVEVLSSGTRDLVVFGARLALAEKAGSHSLLVLDEPFGHLDAEREAGAVKMLRVFQERKGWQIIVLTKEQRLAQRLDDALIEAAVIELDRAPSCRPAAS